jgi:hypothetical protein
MQKTNTLCGMVYIECLPRVVTDPMPRKCNQSITKTTKHARSADLCRKKSECPSPPSPSHPQTLSSAKSNTSQSSSKKPSSSPSVPLLTRLLLVVTTTCSISSSPSLRTNLFSILAATPATRSSSPESYVCVAVDETRIASTSWPKSHGESSLLWCKSLIRSGVAGRWSLELVVLSWISGKGRE